MIKQIQSGPQPIVGTAISSISEEWDMGFHDHPGIELSVVLEGGAYLVSSEMRNNQAQYIRIISEKGSSFR